MIAQVNRSHRGTGKTGSTGCVPVLSDGLLCPRRPCLTPGMKSDAESGPRGHQAKPGVTGCVPVLGRVLLCPGRPCLTPGTKSGAGSGPRGHRAKAGVTGCVPVLGSILLCLSFCFSYLLFWSNMTTPSAPHRQPGMKSLVMPVFPYCPCIICMLHGSVYLFL